MGGYFQRGYSPVPDMKRKIVGSLAAIENHISTEASDEEMFGLAVAKEVLSNANHAELERAIKKVTNKNQ